MAKAHGPLMSMGASGTLAGALTFSTWKGRPVVRSYAKPSNPKTTGQKAVRAGFKGLVALYKSEISDDQLVWKGIGTSMQITALNAFLSAGQKRFQAGESPQQLPTIVVGSLITAPSDGAAAKSGNQVTVTWTPPGIDDPFCQIIYRGISGFTPAPSNIVAVVLGTASSWVDPTPFDAASHYYAIAEGNAAGKLGAPSSLISAS
jgi:hypothetical protein